MIVSVALGDIMGAPSTIATQVICVPLWSGVTVMDSISITVPLSLGKANEGFRSEESLKSDPFISQSTLAPDSWRHLNEAVVSIGYVKVVFIGYSINAAKINKLIANFI